MLIRSMLIMIALTTSAAAQESRDSIKDIFGIKDDDAEEQADASEKKLLIPAALATGKLTTFVALFKSAQLTEELDSRRPLTVFAPTDEAIDQLPEGTITRLLKPENRDQLVAWVKNHVVRSVFDEQKLRKVKQLKTMHDENWIPEINEDVLTINHAKILQADIRFQKGVLHIIDTVMTPKE